MSLPSGQGNRPAACQKKDPRHPNHRQVLLVNTSISAELSSR
jgi:hypothetical protein